MFNNNLWENAYVENIIFTIYILTGFWLCQDRGFNVIDIGHDIGHDHDIG